MKNWEVALIVVAVIVVGYMWWQSSGTQTANPTNSASAGLKKSGCSAIL